MAIEDPHQRIEYIRSMASFAGSSGGSDMSLAFGNIRQDLALIQKPEVRSSAQAIFQSAVGTIYLLERDPEAYPSALSEALERLAAFLEEFDK